MFLNQQSKKMTDTVVSHLFHGEIERLREWVDVAQARALECEQSGASIPQQMSSNVAELDRAALKRLCATIDRTGFAHYAWCDEAANPTASLNQLLRRLGLTQSDSGIIRDKGELSLLQDLAGTARGRFPAYRASAMNWHTDGYYNGHENSVRCFSLHCLHPASQGGALHLMDDTLLVLALLKDDPHSVALLSHPHAMTLPKNQDELGHNRPDRCVPVILRNDDDTLSMRFTTRTQHIQWRTDATKQAAHRALELIQQNAQWHTRLCLRKGEGVITRNVLHTREAFIDAPGVPKRQMLRGRFSDLPHPTVKTLEKNNPMADETHAPR